MDSGFPVFSYEVSDSALARGEKHGEHFRDKISELVEIRLGLLRERRPDFSVRVLKRLAEEQWQKSKDYAPDILQELEGIRNGSNSSVFDLVILNNYTDFRDIPLPEEGCSTVAVKGEEGVLMGYTWDMHGSAMDYLLALEIPGQEDIPAQVVFSVVGCCGMSGANMAGAAASINNLNTSGAKPSPMWPVVIRKLLEQRNLKEMATHLQTVQIGGGRAYLMADSSGAEIWEVSPDLKVLQGSLEQSQYIFHTNHCLTEEMQAVEDVNSLSSTTHSRYGLLEELVPEISSENDMRNLLGSHKGEPKSICSHYQSNSQDPSQTCGVGLINFSSRKLSLWRGCTKSDTGIQEHSWKLEGDANG